MPTQARQTGMTLVELVISIIVLSVAVVGVLSALGTIAGRSADPMIREQSIAIAEAYLEEISLSQFASVASCPAVPGGGGRANFSHICHYHGLSDTGARDQYSTAIAALADKGIRSERNEHAWVQSEFNFQLIKRRKIYPGKIKSYLLTMQDYLR